MILWLTGKAELSDTMKGLFLSILREHGVYSTDILFTSLHIKVPDLITYPKKGVPAEFLQRATKHALTQMISVLKPKVIVLNDEPTLRGLIGKPWTLATTRGSVLYFGDVPMIVLDKLSNLHRMHHGKFVFSWDLKKLVRFAKGQQRREPKFDFRLCKTVADVRGYCERAKRASFITTDKETAFKTTTVISYTYDEPDGRLVTFCVPFFDPWKVDGSYWSLEEDLAVRRCLIDLHEHAVVKGTQNGMYDAVYDLQAGMPLVNWFLDSAYMMHAIEIEAPKDLASLASYFLDNYTYWKDDNKGMKEEGWGSKPSDMFTYWRYNGLDTYYPWLIIRDLLSLITRLPWALRNYDNNISLAAGPCLAASVRGLLVNRGRHAQIMGQKQKEADAAYESVRKLTCEKTFNPRSPDDNAWFLYDVLGVKPTRLQKRKGSKYSKRSTDEKVLKLIREQGNFIADEFIERLLKAKKPASVISNFGNFDRLCFNGRFLSWLNPTGTTTFRFNSTKSQFWTGRNAQNLQQFIREFFEPDPDYAFVDIDFSASDDRFVAYESEDPAKIETVEGAKDSHCFHCSIFFSKPYEVIEAGWKSDDPAIVDEPKGLRQITKKITHGRNYREEAETMYNLMGRDAVVATAEALGHVKATMYTDRQLIGICSELIDKYDHPTRGLYKRIRRWQDEIVELCKKMKGLMTNAYGLTRHFMGSMDAHDTQRTIAAQYGQSNTAGNVNRSLRSIFYSGIDDGVRCLFLLQVHDSLVFAIRRDSLHLISDIIRIMEQKVTIHGRQMRVPASPKIGLTWGKKMLAWKPETTWEDVLAFEEKTFGKKYPKTVVTAGGLNSAELDNLDSLDFGLGGKAIDFTETNDELSDLDPEDDDGQLSEVEALTSAGVFFHG